MACLLRNNQETEEVGVYGFSLFVSEEDAKPQLTLADHVFQTWGLGPVSRKSRELFGPEKPFVKLRPAYSVKLVFSRVVEGIKMKITAKFRASRHLHFEDTKRIMSPDLRPKSFGTFEKQAPVSQKSRNFSGVYFG